MTFYIAELNETDQDIYLELPFRSTGVKRKRIENIRLFTLLVGCRRPLTQGTKRNYEEGKEGKKQPSTTFSLQTGVLHTPAQPISQASPSRR